MQTPLEPALNTARFQILRAAHLGMCFGVRDAIDLAMAHTEPLTILGDLVHNEIVLHQLSAAGIKFEHAAAPVTTSDVMITAHGASDRARAALKAQGLNVVEATCPLVSFAHRMVLKLAKDGFHPVIIGKRDHVEVRGLTGDLDDFDVVLSEVDVRCLQPRPRFGVAAQTTQPIDHVRHLVRFMEECFPVSEVRFVDTVCHPTKQRQTAAIALARQCDVIIVIGGANSNNTRELVKTCQRFCARVHHARSAEDLRVGWLSGVGVVGITAGTSTPDSLIDEVEAWLTVRGNGEQHYENVAGLLRTQSHPSLANPLALSSAD